MGSESRGFYRGKSIRVGDVPHELKVPTNIPLADARQVARASGFTGDLCSQCGGIHMQMAGHCMVCADCGTTTGCS